MNDHDTFKPTDGYGLLHEKQTEEDHGLSDLNPSQFEGGTDAGAVELAELARAKDTADRRKRGGRKDLGEELDHLPGTRAIPYKLLSHGTKLARGRSMAAATVRRDKRRAQCGILLHLDQRAYKRAGNERREAFDKSKSGVAHLTGRTWDFGADFYWLDDDRDAAQHLDHLFRSAGPTVQPKQTFRQYLREQQT